LSKSNYRPNYLGQDAVYIPGLSLLLIVVCVSTAAAVFVFLPQQSPIWLLPLLPLVIVYTRGHRSEPDKQELTVISTGGLNDKTTLIRFLLDAMSVAGRYNRSLSLVLLEVQISKSLTEPGQQHMEVLVDQLQTILRLPDRIGCFGGDSLLLLLPETNANAAAQVANRCQDLSVCNDAQNEVAKVSKTVVASYHFGDDLQSLLDRLNYDLSGNAAASV